MANTCFICLEEFEKTIKCPDGVVFCGDCLNQGLSDIENILRKDGKMKCPCSPQGGHFDLQIWIRHIIGSELSLEQKESLLLLFPQKALSLCQEQVVATEDEFRFAMKDFARKIEGLSVHCPRCLAPFDDFTNCLAIRCECPTIVSAPDDRGANICALCLKWSRIDVHAHAMHCASLARDPVTRNSVPLDNIFVQETKKHLIFKKHLANKIAHEILKLDSSFKVLAFNYLLYYLEQSELTGEVRNMLEISPENIYNLAVYDTFTAGVNRFKTYDSPEIVSITSISLKYKAPTLVWFEDKRTGVSVKTYAIFCPPHDTSIFLTQTLDINKSGFQVAVSREELDKYEFKFTPDNLVQLYNQESEIGNPFIHYTLNRAQSLDCMTMLQIGIPYVYIYNRDGSILDSSILNYANNNFNFKHEMIVIYPNKTLMKLKVLTDSYGRPRIRLVHQIRRILNHNEPLNLSKNNLLGNQHGGNVYKKKYLKYKQKYTDLLKLRGRIYCDQ